jgi:hypothetical protein
MNDMRRALRNAKGVGLENAEIVQFKIDTNSHDTTCTQPSQSPRPEVVFNMLNKLGFLLLVLLLASVCWADSLPEAEKSGDESAVHMDSPSTAARALKSRLRARSLWSQCSTRYNSYYPGASVYCCYTDGSVSPGNDGYSPRGCSALPSTKPTFYKTGHACTFNNQCVSKKCIVVNGRLLLMSGGGGGGGGSGGTSRHVCA